MTPLDAMIVSPNALAQTTERNFPESRHRSARIRKKLIKRFGSEFRMEPAAFRLPGGRMIVHPVIYQQIKAALPPGGRP